MRDLPQSIQKDLIDYLKKTAIMEELIKLDSNSKNEESFDIIKNKESGLYLLIYEEKGLDKIIFESKNMIEAIIRYVEILKSNKIIR